MKFRVTMKNPDCVSQAVDDAIADEPHKEVEIKLAISQWFEYNEYLEVEIDTESDTCIVIEQGCL